MFREIWIPTAVRYGVPESEFWKMSPKTFGRRLPYFEEMQKQRRQDMHNSAWVDGQYIQMAIAACLSKGFHYPESPVDLYEEEKEPEEIIFNAVAEFRRMANAHNSKIEEVNGNA